MSKLSTRPKPDIGKDMYFETMKEFYDDGVKVCPLDSEDIIVIEKGRAIYDALL